MHLQTQRLQIRPVSLDDQAALFAYRSLPEVNQFLSSVPSNVEDIAKFITRSASEIDVPDTWFQLVLVCKDAGEVIGDIGVHFLTDTRQVELGYTLHPKRQGQGLATEALTQLIDHLFTNRHKHRITASVDPTNQASIRVLEKLGFRKEAHFVESLFFHGKWVDDVIYAILAREWKENQQ